MENLIGRRPKIGVCALNPHAGEEGLFGDEEQRIIAPAVVEGRRGGLQIEGPYPADTLLLRARDGQFDAVVAMYHDQGHIALKLLGMHRAVNITLGLPIVRTSVAHGTAFDLGLARPRRNFWHDRSHPRGSQACQCLAPGPQLLAPRGHFPIPFTICSVASTTSTPLG